MHKLYELRDNLCDELCSLADEGVSSSNIQMIDTVAHAAKNVYKVIRMMSEEECCNRGMSYGRDRNVRHDSKDRYSGDDGYSRDEDMIHEMNKIAETLPSNERTKMDQIIQRMKRM